MLSSSLTGQYSITVLTVLRRRIIFLQLRHGKKNDAAPDQAQTPIILDMKNSRVTVLQYIISFAVPALENEIAPTTVPAPQYCN
jgi:hypothetical protein